jgi:hypothetical protein
MKAIALTFDYDLTKMKTNGRFWAEKVYGVEVLNIFKYSAASYATFIKTNPNIPLTIYTNDVDLIKDCLSDYDIDLTNVNYVDYTNQIIESKKSPYTFQPIVDLCYSFKDTDEYILKIDNDLIWHKPIPKIDEKKDILVWKFERYVKDGDPRMGEILVCEKVCGTTNFKEYNIGVLGYPIGYPISEFYEISNQMTMVDIKSVSDLGVNIGHCCEQTAQSWIFHKYNYNIIETHSFVEHLYENKLECVEKAKNLLK